MPPPALPACLEGGIRLTSPAYHHSRGCSPAHRLSYCCWTCHLPGRFTAIGTSASTCLHKYHLCLLNSTYHCLCLTLHSWSAYHLQTTHGGYWTTTLGYALPTDSHTDERLPGTSAALDLSGGLTPVGLHLNLHLTCHTCTLPPHQGMPSGTTCLPHPCLPGPAHTTTTWV